ncbi:hypothetical protein F7734_18915 [Scytonema sp. UIC 10036]|uniref:hypothetical protein n=1 Tax=Scytonema sp. UIC 10036 TaxID=2304196 RepID=UPI0012DA71F3|nr:hypothetical protein [Scytonema sp. UIC 10036]MUG94336.1 hypothetical protein [Scytonema sp. UIC 10036]
MPSRQWQFRIQDIVGAIAAIQQRVDGMSLEDFRKNGSSVLSGLNFSENQLVILTGLSLQS